MTLALWLASDVYGDDETQSPERAPRVGRSSNRKDASAPAAEPTSQQAFAISREDQALVVRLRAGDEHAFARVAAQQWDALWTFAYRMVHSADAASDIVQDALFALWSHRERIDPERGVRAYLFGTVRFRALKLRRHAQLVRRVETEHDAVSISGVGEHARGDADPTNEQELAEALERVIATLPESRREVLVLRWWHGLTYEEIATILGVGVSAVKMQVHRAAAQLRPLLDREFRDTP